VNAFIAMGGNLDKSGFISAEKLVQIVKDFELTRNVDTKM
jgi:hypothetical protein